MNSEKKSINFIKSNNELLNNAERMSVNLKINLKNFYENNVIIRNEYQKLNNAKKIPYDQLTNIDSEAANNGFVMLVRDLENISNFVNEFYDGDFELFQSDELNNDMVEGTLKTISYAFEHVCKWHGIVNSQIKK